MSDRDPVRFRQALIESGLAGEYTPHEQELIFKGWLWHCAVVEKRQIDLLSPDLNIFPGVKRT